MTFQAPADSGRARSAPPLRVTHEVATSAIVLNLPRSQEQHVLDAAVEPYLTAAVVMPAADRFFENMRVVTAKPVHLLIQPKMHLGHQVPVTLVPHIAAVSEAAGHSHTVGLDGVFAQRFGVERRKLTMPVNDLVIAFRIARGRFADRTGEG